MTVAELVRPVALFGGCRDGETLEGANYQGRWMITPVWDEEVTRRRRIWWQRGWGYAYESFHTKGMRVPPGIPAPPWGEDRYEWAVPGRAARLGGPHLHRVRPRDGWMGCGLGPGREAWPVIDLSHLHQLTAVVCAADGCDAPAVHEFRPPVPPHFPPVRIMFCYCHCHEAFGALQPTTQLAAAWCGFNRAN